MSLNILPVVLPMVRHELHLPIFILSHCTVSAFMDPVVVSTTMSATMSAGTAGTSSPETGKQQPSGVYYNIVITMSCCRAASVVANSCDSISGDRPCDGGDGSLYIGSL